MRCLAVGDTEFQKKCLGKMNEVSRAGRTVILVSHILPAILNLCSRAMLLETGSIQFRGTPKAAVDLYLSTRACAELTRIDLSEAPRSINSFRKVVLSEAIWPHLDNGKRPWQFEYQAEIAFQVVVRVTAPVAEFCFGMAIFNSLGWEIASSLSTHHLISREITTGSYLLSVKIPALGLIPGMYRVGLSVRSELGFEDYTDSAFRFEIVPNELAGRHRVETFGGVVVPAVYYTLDTL